MQQSRHNIYDDTKRMLNTLRNFKSKHETQNRLHEQIDTEREEPVDIEQDKNDIAVIDDVDIQINSSDEADLELDEESKSAISQMLTNFKTQVSQIVEFDPGITINENQIRLDGSLTEIEIDFVFIAGEESGLYINSDMLKLEDDALEFLQKLKTFEESFLTSMNSLIDKRKNNIPNSNNKNL